MRSCKRVTGTVCDKLSAPTACNAEIEQLRNAFAGHQNIRGLDVPVHHQVAVRELNCRADLHEQLSRSRMNSVRLSQYESMVSPSTYSITR